MIQTQLRNGIAILFWVGVLLAAVHYPLSTAVLAHADYDDTVPAVGEVVSQAPQQVQVWFTQELFRREGQNTLEVYGPDDQRVDLDDAAIDDDNRKLMTVSLQSDLPNGVYTVRWRTLSADDGDTAEGEFQFTIQADEPESTPTATSTPVPTATAEAVQPSPTNTAQATPTATSTPVPTAAAEAVQPSPTNTAQATPTATSTPVPTAAAEAVQPSPTNTAKAEGAELQSTPTTADQGSEGPETPPGQADRDPAFPCLGSSAPFLLLLGAFILARSRRKPGERRSQGVSRNLGGENS